MAEPTQNQHQIAYPTAASPNIPVSVPSYNFQTSVFGMGPPGFVLPGMYTNSTTGHQAKPGSHMDKQHTLLNKAHHAPSGSNLTQLQEGAGPSHIIDLCDNDSSTSSNVDSEPTTATVYLQVLNPRNKKQVLNMHTLRDFPCDLQTPDELRGEIFCRCSESEVSRDLKFDVGYFKQGKKLWLNSLQDLKDAWSLLNKGGRLTFWCNGVQKEETTRKRASNSEADGTTKKKRVSGDSKAEQVTEMKSELKQMHGVKFNELQYRLWAEVLVSGVYTDTQNPPPYPMFGKARQK